MATPSQVQTPQADGHNELARRRGPDEFEVFDIADPTRPSSNGTFATLEEARGCVEFDGLKFYEIWQGDHIVAGRDQEGVRQSLRDTPISNLRNALQILVLAGPNWLSPTDAFAVRELVEAALAPLQEAELGLLNTATVARTLKNSSDATMRELGAAMERAL